MKEVKIKLPEEFELELMNVESKKIDRRVNTKIKNVAGIYFLYDEEGKLTYIGQTQNIRMRLHWHLLNGTIPKFVRFQQIDNKYDRIAIESLLIKLYSPSKNVL